MLDISQFFNTDTIIPNLGATTREDAIRKLIDKVFENPKVHSYGISKEEVFDDVMRRELAQSTGIGEGLAFPHARVDKWGDFAMAIGINDKGIDFTSLDSAPVQFVFLMISSNKEPYIILQTMAAIIKFLTEIGYGKGGAVPDPARIFEVLQKFTKINVSGQILAADIANPETNAVDLEVTIEELTAIMHLKRLDVLPVVDCERKFQGVVSCLELFEYGMPDFFKQLHTVSFVRNIDPFEKFFKLKKDLKVRDIYLKHAKPVKKDATLLEIVFEMSVKHKNCLYVVDDDNTLIGAIDRFCIIEKILFF